MRKDKSTHDAMAKTVIKMTLLWTFLGFFWVMQFISSAIALPQEVRGTRSFSHWGYPTCHEATDFAYIGFTKVQEAMLTAGTSQCPEDWKQEYSGYLVTWRREDSVASTELECVNVTKTRSTLRSSQFAEGQTLIFYTNSACGGLRWPPYGEDAVVTMCAVCAKLYSPPEEVGRVAAPLPDAFKRGQQTHLH